ncbi:hypothetical protein BDR05DRAFT_947964 [Suillus weaverae]|nr:hypothetical protein BDR05DRAFT_947964 [Suillus weaverae]
MIRRVTTASISPGPPPGHKQAAAVLTEDDSGNTHTILLSPNERILASHNTYAAQLWNLETNLPIGTPLCHEDWVNSFSADGKFLVTRCDDDDDFLYTWDVCAIVKEAGLPSDIADATPRPAPKMKGAPRIPPGFFDDALREANLRIRLSQSHGPHNCPTPPPLQRTLNPFSSFWHRSNSHRTTEPDTQLRSRALSWTRNLVSGILRKRDGSDIQLREVEVPYTAGKPRNYHARKKKPAASSSRPPNTHNTQQPRAHHHRHSNYLPLSATASTLLAVAGTAGTTGTISSPRITIAGWRARFVGWRCCMPVQHTNGQH